LLTRLGLRWPRKMLIAGLELSFSIYRLYMSVMSIFNSVPSAIYFHNFSYIILSSSISSWNSAK
jgi:hypothetical protein